MNRQAYLQELERKFLATTPQKPATLAQQLNIVESRGGVYGIWEETKLRYFGETCHLNHRLFEIVVIGRHHSLNLLMGAEAIGRKGKEKSAWLCSRSSFTVAWMVVDIGRTELEEYMVLKYAADLKNHQGGRFGLRGDITEWLKMIKEPNHSLELPSITSHAEARVAAVGVVTLTSRQ